MPITSAAVEPIIADYAPQMAAKMRDIADASHSEEDVRHGCNVLVEQFFSQAGLAIPGRHEYGLKGGRIDSKYGGVILEYKDPHGNGKIGDSLESPGTKKVVEQIKQRFRDFETEEKTEPQRLFGVGCDGRRMVFVRFRGKSFQVEPPQPVTAHSVERLLRAFCSVGAHGAPYTPERLTESFGANSVLGRDGIAKLYAVISTTQNAKALTFFSQWRILFGEVCGYDVYGKNEKINQLAQHYGTEEATPAPLLFAIHTYYAIFIKLLAAEIASSFSPLGTSILKKCVAAPTAAKLREELGALEQGGIWAQLGITNFLEGDLFSWYLPAWNDSLSSVVKAMVQELDGYDPTTLSVEPAESRDLLKKLYHHLFPKSVRHDLGEYYTPDWLAEQTLDELGYDGNPDKRLLDPSCGSGTFLVMAINRARAWFEEHQHECGYDESELVGKILRNIIGFDLNPLAVMAARTNFLIAIRGLLKTAGAVELPIYLCDAVLTPSKYSDLFTGSELGKVRKLRTSVGDFNIPAEVTDDRELIGRYAEVLETCVRQKYSSADFLARCETEGLPTAETGLHRLLYEQLRDLDAENKNGIWARIIKNAFAPLFIGKVDFVAGNPPWINWESLPGDYRDAMKPLWKDYGLFSLSNSAGRLGGGKKDLSMLFVYVGVDNYLKDGGRLGFVITQTIFKTKGAGDGFRRLRFGVVRPVYLKPVAVADLSDIQVFEGATNRTAIFVCEKQKTKFDYPVPYTVWRGPNRIAQEENHEAVLAATTRTPFGAAPINPKDVNSPWLTAKPEALDGIHKVIGKSKYKAYAGCCTWMNGVYWLDVKQKLPNGNLVIENLWDVGKIKVPLEQTAIESGLVYPLLRWRDVLRWKAVPSAHIILTQDPETRTGIAESTMKRKYPKSFAYLKASEALLRGRSGFKKYFEPSDPFYSMYNVGTQILEPWKVMWPEVGNTIRAGVCGPQEVETEKPALPDHTIVAVSCESGPEAHYICALLNSAPAQSAASGYIVLHPSPHVLEHIAIPRFKPADPTHTLLADLSERCHEATAQGDEATLADLQAQVDRAAAQLWGIDDGELTAIQQALSEMQKIKPAAKATDEAEDEDGADTGATRGNGNGIKTPKQTTPADTPPLSAEETLREEYHDLVDREMEGKLTKAQSARLDRIKEQLDTLDEQDPREQAMDARVRAAGEQLDRMLEELQSAPLRASEG